MASNFTVKRSANVSTSLTSIGGYTVGANVGAVIVGLTVSNTTNTQVFANVVVNNGTNDYYLVKNAPIAENGTLIVVGSGHKVILQPGDTVKASSSADASIDAMLNIMETSDIGVTVDDGGGGGTGGDGNSYTTGVNLVFGGTGSTSLSPLVFDTYFMTNQPFANEWVVNRQFRVDRLTQSAVYRIDVIGYVTDTDVGMAELTKISGDDIIGVADFTTNTTFTFLLP